MIKQTTRAEAASGPDGDDNRPGSEPPPHDRISYVMSRRSLRAAGGLRRPSESRALPTFLSTIYLMMMCAGLRSQPILRHGDLRDSMAYERSEGMGPNRRNPRIGAVYLASAKTDSFDIVLLSQQFWP
ncbi:hypothetical protein THAOC_34973 [Thalassiosira oceanica]|uniref:Uncharacterized protein n=1 Tax=Thalassiosira oceanica TaxID=159749 RepID=K0RB99_THAOC|nr:hypothetical protein THAOC_34973 [Thalassiosira oceanica]|eukprot:EJK46361.1 hypothetical protein THAOC_34973 [Thalassiosira oceanica]